MNYVTIWLFSACAQNDNLIWESSFFSCLLWFFPLRDSLRRIAQHLQGIRLRLPQTKFRSGQKVLRQQMPLQIHSARETTKNQVAVNRIRTILQRGKQKMVQHQITMWIHHVQHLHHVIHPFHLFRKEGTMERQAQLSLVRTVKNISEFHLACQLLKNTTL